MAEKKKHLHELLEDDQEPFHLNHYISDLRSQMGYSDLRVKKRKSDNNAATFPPPGLFSCESSCFFTAHKSPDPRKSPLFELRSPGKKKTRDGRVFLQIPARTAAILLDAAARIQKQQSEKGKTTNKARTRGNGFGMFGSVLKLLTNRKPKPRLDNADENAISLERGSEPTSSSSRRERFVEIGDKCFCDSPFHFVLQTSPSSSGPRTPHFTSTATSPARRSTEDEDSDETESLEKVRGQEEEDKEEEDKEQCSPVSVLDPLEEEEEEEDEDHQHEPDHLNLLPCSFDVVQRAKRRLLKKLRRFEKLAGLDPVELEGKMSEEEEDEEEEEEYEDSEEDDNIRIYDSDEEYEDVDEAMTRESRCAEEERSKKKNDERQKKWRMMNAWKVGLGAEEDVDVVVRKDMREETREWTKHGGEVEEAVSDLELSIFFFLIDELSHELVSSSP
ncbi:PREDICTED: uncharacterized protein LOC104782063 [Camelina sativa]|uniref:Uncharacterized protein LOC104782063 n=1 Tax=Camelina sativa TaxID=90675 RepID=A0ABM0YSD5_CAMSA|nr:PREDICTED: uncharacterized protein LOC104782063 [Camelina sativa]